MPLIEGFMVERQQGPEMCWAAALRSVLEHYYRGQSPEQETLRLRFGVQGQEAASPEPALRRMGGLGSVEAFLGDEAAMSQAARIFVKIHDHVVRRQPVIVYVQQTGGGGFRHALVIYGTSGADTVHLRDPANPGLALEANIHQLVTHWRIYGGVPQAQHMPLYVYARRFFFTTKPGSFFHLA